MRMRAGVVWVVVAFVMLDHEAAAAQRGVPLQKRVGFELLTSAVEVDVEGTGLRAWGGQLNLGLTAFRVLDGRVDLGALRFRDERPLVLDTTGLAQASRVTAGLASVALGARTPPLALGPNAPVNVSVGAGMGYTWIAASRGPAYCLNACPGARATASRAESSGRPACRSIPVAAPAFPRASAATGGDPISATP